MSDEEMGKDSPRSEEGEHVEGGEVEPEPAEAGEVAAEQKGEGEMSDKPAAKKVCAIYVGDIGNELTEEDLSEFFGKKGKLSRCEVKEKGKRSSRYCFVEYEDEAITEDVLKECMENPPSIKGYKLKVERANGPREMRCFNCGQTGHKAVDCKEPRKSNPRRRSGRRSDYHSRRSSSRGRSHSRSRSRSHSRHSHSHHYRRSRSRSDSRDRNHGRRSDRDRDHDRDRDRDRHDRYRDRDRDERRSSRHEERRSSHRDSSVHDRHRSRSASRSRSPRRS